MGDHSTALTDEGKVYAWGYNSYGQLGLGDSGFGTERNTPTLISITIDVLNTAVTITGTPTETILDSSFNIRATIANGGLYSKDISLNFTVADISYTDFSYVFLKDVAINDISANELYSKFTYAQNGGPALPTNLTFDTSGVISGLPNATILDSSFNIRATIANGGLYSKDISLNFTVADISYDLIDLSHVFLKDVAINTVEPNEVNSTFIYTLTSGSNALPIDISFGETTGDISGTPRAVILDSSFSITATVPNTTYSKDFSFNYTVADVSYAPIDLSHVFLKDVTINIIEPNELYSNDFTYSLTSGSAALPSNIALDASSGDISGTPIATVLDSSFSITATLDGTTYSKDFSFNYTVADVSYAPIDLSHVFLKDVGINVIQPNELYSNDFTYSLTSGSATLPSNIAFDASSGDISGTPIATVLDSSFSITATLDGTTYSKDFSFNYTVADVSYAPIDLSHVFLKDVGINVIQPNELYSNDFTYSLTSGSAALPSNIAFDASSGDISGTPISTVLDSSFSITATLDGTTYSKDFSFNYTVADINYTDFSYVFLKDVTINDISANELYSKFTYAQNGGPALPTNLTFDTSGVISGLPNATILDSSFNIRATMANGGLYSKDISLNLSVADINYTDFSYVFLKDVAINDISANELYSKFTYAQNGGPALPTNLTFDTSGVISGLPNATILDSSFNIRATMANGGLYSKDISLNFTVADINYTDFSYVFLKDVSINVIEPNEVNSTFIYTLTNNQFTSLFLYSDGGTSPITNGTLNNTQYSGTPQTQTLNPTEDKRSYSLLNINPEHNKSMLDAWVGWQGGLSDEYLTIDLDNIILVAGVVTKGRGDGKGQWVTDYKVSFSTDGTNYLYITETGTTTDTNNAYVFPRKY